MYTKQKSNGLSIIFLLIFLCVFILSPATYMKSTLDGLYVWLNNVLPSLFPFFIATKLLYGKIDPSGGFAKYMDKFSYRLFKTRSGSGYIYFMSIISGYPVGAKLLADKYNNGEIDGLGVTNMLSFCSTSGPLFLLGAVGMGILHSYSAGLILLISHIIGSLLNGIIYRQKKVTNMGVPKKNDTNLNDAMYNSITSILLVGGFIAISFVVVDMLVNTQVIHMIAKGVHTISGIEVSVIEAVLCGLIEMTRGCIEINSTALSLGAKTIICSGMIAFSGVCVFLQTLCFLTDKSIKRSKILLQKTTQAILTIIVCAIIVVIFKV